MNLPTSNCR